MTQQTKIEWTDFTVNFWEGCQKVGPGCDHCYAEARDARFTGGKHWGPGAPRRYVKGGIAKLRKINREAEQFHAKHGRWPRVFCSSLSDIFDNAVDPAWRAEAFKELTSATNIRPQLLTKRIGNVFQMIPPAWASKQMGGWPQHVGLMITVVNQAEADRDIPKLLDLKARLGIPWVGLSMEPLLGPVRLDRVLSPKIWGDNDDGWTFDCLTTGDYYTLFGEGPSISSDGPWREVAIDWVIVGGESGHKARPTHPDWIRSLRDQCETAGTPFLFKQWGEWADHTRIHSASEKCGASSDMVITHDGHIIGGGSKAHGGLVDLDWEKRRAAWMCKVGKARAGRLLDGREWNGVPT